MASSWFVANYEALASSGNLNANGAITYPASNIQVGLCNEGPIGYAGLALVVFSALMFCRDFLALRKDAEGLSSLIKASTNEVRLNKGVNV